MPLKPRIWDADNKSITNCFKWIYLKETQSYMVAAEKHMWIWMKSNNAAEVTTQVETKSARAWRKSRQGGDRIRSWWSLQGWRADGLQVKRELEQVPRWGNVVKATSWKINVAQVQIQTHGQREAWGSADLPPIEERPFKSCVFWNQRCRVQVLLPSVTNCINDFNSLGITFLIYHMEINLCLIHSHEG